jgi:hypothetical protein
LNHSKRIGPFADSAEFRHETGMQIVIGDILKSDDLATIREALEKAESGADLTSGEELSFIRVAGKLAQARSRYKKLTIHRYNPTEDLGGMIGMLNFT